MSHRQDDQLFYTYAQEDFPINIQSGLDLFHFNFKSSSLTSIVYSILLRGPNESKNLIFCVS